VLYLVTIVEHHEFHIRVAADSEAAAKQTAAVIMQNAEDDGLPLIAEVVTSDPTTWTAVEIE
jgi:hypothetical protein